MMQSAWSRSENGIFAGVCSGLAKKLEVDPWLVRFMWIFAILFFGMGIFLYLLLWISLPRDDRIAQAYDSRVLGVCARLARDHVIDIGLARFIALLLLFASFGWAVFVYVVLYFVLPDKRPSVSTATKRDDEKNEQ